MSIDAAIKEYVDSTVAKAVEEALSRINVDTKECQQVTHKIIRGISGLAQFLGVSIPTAQKMKNQHKIPFRQQGRILIFIEDEVLDAMKRMKR